MKFLIPILFFFSLAAQANNNRFCFGYSDMHRIQLEIRPLSGDPSLSKFHFRFFTYENNQLTSDFVALGQSLVSGRGIRSVFESTTGLNPYEKMELVVAGGDAQLRYTNATTSQRADLACVDIE